MEDEPHPVEHDEEAPLRVWPTRHSGGYPPGWRVRYRHRAASRANPMWQVNAGTVAGNSLRDEHTSTTWVPIRPRGSATDRPVDLVRATDILDAYPPHPGDQARS